VCGIAGLFEPSLLTSGVELRAQVAGMTATLTHRGPDAEGSWCQPADGIYFGHRRLSVIDLGPEGSQPMHSQDGRWVVCYNGEIYNHPALRDRLSGEGMAFRGQSDTEVLVGAIQRWGLLSALEASEGMFAMAAWDRNRRQLHLVRDRFGEKPMYYGWVGDALAFGSELKALQVLPRFDSAIDRDAVALFLRHNCVPAPHTIYRKVVKLSPGQLVTFDAGSRPGRLPSPRNYWSAGQAIEEAKGHPVDGSADQLADHLEAVLSDSVRARMVADVPVGAFLSGGVDSSLLVALIQRNHLHPVRTFTVGFADRAFDESHEAAAIATHLGTDHTAIQISDDEAVELLPALSDIWDEPFGDVSQIPMLVVSRLARTRVTVCLSGDGGDELFAGYNRHAWLDRLWRRMSVLPGPVRQTTGSALGRLSPAWVDGVARLASLPPVRMPMRLPSSKVAKLAKVMSASGPEDAYLSLVSYWPEAESMVNGAGPNRSVASRPSMWPELDGITEQMLWLDLVGYLPDDILTKVDRAAMSTSLETRVPFLDRSVFDFAWRLPLSMKLHNGSTKWLLRQVLYRHVPRELVERPKMGFGFPIGSMLLGRLRPWAEELLGQRRLEDQGLLDPAPIRRAWRLHLAGRRDMAHELWDVLALQAWLDRWTPDLGH
jgi:asparagine synthase (glutamine-hydrolysing)